MTDQLEQLADRIRAALGPTRTSDGRWTDATRALFAELTDAVTNAGHPRRLAEYAVTGWIITLRPIRQCIQDCIADGLWQLPPPRRDLQGFAAGSTTR